MHVCVFILLTTQIKKLIWPRLSCGFDLEVLTLSMGPALQNLRGLLSDWLTNHTDFDMQICFCFCLFFVFFYHAKNKIKKHYSSSQVAALVVLAVRKSELEKV